MADVAFFGTRSKRQIEVSTATTFDSIMTPAANRAALYPADTIRKVGGSLSISALNRTSDESLLELHRQGYSEAAHVLLSRYQNIIQATARRMVPKGMDAGDVASEIYLHLFNVVHTCRNTQTLPGWIKRISINVFHTLYQKNRRHQSLSLDQMIEDAGEAALPRVNEAPLLRLESELVLGRFDKAVASLPETYRKVWDLYFREERSYEEIAQIMDLSLGTVKSRLFRAREALQRKLGDCLAA